MLLGEYKYNQQLEAHNTQETFPVATIMPVKGNEPLEFKPQTLNPALFKRNPNALIDQHQDKIRKGQEKYECNFVD